MLFIHLRLMHVTQKRGGETHPILAKHEGAVSGNCTELMLGEYLSDCERASVTDLWELGP